MLEEHPDVYTKSVPGRLTHLVHLAVSDDVDRTLCRT